MKSEAFVNTYKNKKLYEQSRGSQPVQIYRDTVLPTFGTGQVMRGLGVKFPLTYSTFCQRTIPVFPVNHCDYLSMLFF